MMMMMMKMKMTEKNDLTEPRRKEKNQGKTLGNGGVYFHLKGESKSGPTKQSLVLRTEAWLIYRYGVGDCDR